MDNKIGRTPCQSSDSYNRQILLYENKPLDSGKNTYSFSIVSPGIYQNEMLPSKQSLLNPFPDSSQETILRLGGIDDDSDGLGQMAPVSDGWLMIFSLSLFYFLFLIRKKMNKRFFSFKKQLFVMGTLLIFSLSLQAQNVSISITNPDPFVKWAENEYIVTVNNNTSTTFSNNTLTVTLSSFLRAAKTAVGATRTGSSNLTPTFSISSIAPGTSEVRIKLTNTASAGNLSNEQVTFKLTGTDLSGVNTVSSVTINAITNFKIPLLQFASSPSNNIIMPGVEHVQEWEIEQRTNGAYVQNLKMGIEYTTNANREGVKFQKIEIYTSDNTWESLDLSAINFVKSGGVGYSYILDESVIRKAYPTGKLEFGKILKIRETMIYTTCTSLGKEIYTMVYGNKIYDASQGTQSTNWCQAAEGTSVTITKQAEVPGYSPDAQCLKITYPTSSNENGVVYFKLSNLDNNIGNLMYKVSVIVYNERGKYTYGNDQYEYRTAYFTDNAQNKIGNAPAIVLKDIIDGTGYHRWETSFENVNSSNIDLISAYNGLADLNGDGIYDDLPPGKDVYLAVEWNVNFSKQSLTDCNDFALYETYRYGNFTYTDVCGKKNTFSRGVGETNSTLAFTGRIRFPMDVDSLKNTFSISLAPENVKAGDLAVLTLTTTENYSTGWAFNHPDFEYYGYITIPDGFIFDKNNTNHYLKFKNPGYAVESIDKSNITIMDGTNSGKKLKVKLPRAVTGTSIVYEIKMSATSEKATNKEAIFRHTFTIPGNDPVPYGCGIMPVNYQQIETYQNMTLESFKAERTTFGWSDESMSHRITETEVNAGTFKVRRDVAGPYDNIQMTGKITISEGFDPGNKDLWAVVSYEGADNAANYYFNNLSATLTYNSNQPIQVNAQDFFKDFYINDGIPTHSLKLKITPYLSSTIPTLKPGDVLYVTFYTQTVEESLPTSLRIIPQFSMQAYIDDSSYDPEKNKLANNFYLADYKMDRLYAKSNFGETFNTNGPKVINAIALIPAVAINGTEIFPNEFRPNDKINQYTIVANSLVKVSKMQLQERISGKTVQLTEGSDYTIHYDDCSTTIIITPTGVKAYGEGWSNTYQLIMITGELISYNTTGNRYGVSVDVSANVDFYPSSEAPVVNKNLILTGNALDKSWYFTVSDYKYTISSSKSDSYPMGNEASWPLNIINQSIWGSTSVNQDPILPNSWLSVEFPAGTLLNLSLWDGNTKVGDLTKYDEGKYWIDMGNAEIPTNKIYTLKTNYAECKNKVNLIVSYGSYRGDIKITNPWVGFDFNSDAYSHTMGTSKVCRSVTKQLSLTPSISEFTTGLANPIPDKPDGKYDFCTKHTFTAMFSNSMESEITNLGLKLTIPDGMVWDGNTPQWQQGAKNYTDISGIASINGNILTIPVDGILEGYISGNANPNAHINVQFNLEANCGFVTGSVIAADFYGTSACGAQLSKHSVSPVFSIYGDLSSLPEVRILNMKINGTNIQASGAVPVPIQYRSNADNGQVIINADLYYTDKMKWHEIYVYVDIPENMEMDPDSYLEFPNIMNRVYFTKSGTRLIANIAEPTYLPQNGSISITLNPTQPTDWDCSIKDIYISTLAATDLGCENKEPCSIPVELDKKGGQFQMIKEDLLLDHVSITGSFESDTSESITVSGTLTRTPGSAINNVVISLYLDNDDNDIYSAGDTPISGTSQTISFNEGDVKNFVLNFSVESDNICRLMLVASRNDNPYICSDLSDKPESIEYTTTPVAAICQGDQDGVFVGTESIIGYAYYWNTPEYGNLIPIGNGSNAIYTSDEVPYGQKVILQLTVNRSGGCFVNSETQVTITPSESTWTGKGNPNDWHDYKNWDNGVPGLCTDIIVESGALNNNYPVLQDVANECHEVYFKFGGEIARTNYLTYYSAKVDLTVVRDRWYMLSAPLQNMYSGDYWLAPLGILKGEEDYKRHDPVVYMQQYQTTNPQKPDIIAGAGQWSKSFNTLKVPLKAGIGFLTGIDGAGSDQTFYFPRPETEYEYFNKKAPYNPMDVWDRNLERYTDNSGNMIGSLFYGHGNYPGYKDLYPETTKLVTGRDGNLTLTGVTDQSGYTTILVGNPLMSHLDFKKFAGLNPGIMPDRYYLWNGTSFDAFLTGTNNGDINTNSWISGSELIAPMQSFIVQKTDPSAQISEFSITQEMSVTGGGSTLRSFRISDVFNVELQRNGQRQSGITLIYSPGISNRFKEDKDVPAMFSETDKEPAVLYSLADNHATFIRTLGDLGEPIALAIRTTKKGELTLKLNNPVAIDDPIYLEDRFSGQRIDLTKETYTFNNTSGDIDGRFYLYVANETTGIQEKKISDSGISIYADLGMLYTASQIDDPIRSVEVAGIQGQILMKKDQLNQSQISFPLPEKQKIVIVRVHTEKYMRTEKILIK